MMTKGKIKPIRRPGQKLWHEILWRRIKIMLATVLIIVLLGGGTYFVFPQWLIQINHWREAKLAGLTTHHLQVGKTNWAYYSGGKGPTIVLVHGYSVSRNIWLKIAKPLTHQFHLVIPDLPGWGDSTRIEGADYGVTAQARRLSAFLEAMHIDRPMLVGHSMGGAIAGYYASTHPDRVSSLVLVDSFGLTFDQNNFARKALKGDNPFIFNDRAEFKRTTELTLKKPPHLPGRFIDAMVKHNKANRDFLQRVFNKLREPGQYNALDSRLGKLTMPVLGVWCRGDKVIDPSALTTLRNGLTHSPEISATYINGCDHVPELEKPDVLVQVLTHFALDDNQ